MIITLCISEIVKTNEIKQTNIDSHAYDHLVSGSYYKSEPVARL